MTTDPPSDSTDRAELAQEILDGLAEGFHYSTLAFDGEGNVVEVVWNYDRHIDDPWHTDDFTDREASEQRREIAIKYQEQYDDPPETEQGDPDDKEQY